MTGYMWKKILSGNETATATVVYNPVLITGSKSCNYTYETVLNGIYNGWWVTPCLFHSSQAALFLPGTIRERNKHGPIAFIHFFVVQWKQSRSPALYGEVISVRITQIIYFNLFDFQHELKHDSFNYKISFKHQQSLSFS